MDMHNTKATLIKHAPGEVEPTRTYSAKSVTQELNRREGKHNKKVSWALTYASRPQLQAILSGSIVLVVYKSGRKELIGLS